MSMAEREAMEAIDSPFVISLKYAFSTTYNLFLVMDLMMGGDLCYHLNNAVFTAEQAKYYAARTILGLSVLHLHRYVYRDLKPENILLDSEGFSKLSDLGLARYIESRGVQGICGTRGYWAPEMLKLDDDGEKMMYSYEVDWFSLGCCIFEFLIGVSPFRTEQAKKWGHFDITTRQGKDKAMDLAVLSMEPDLSVISDPVCRDLIQKLLVKDPTRRLGAKGYQEIANHEWFAGIPWETLHCVEPPFKPGRKSNVVKGSEIGTFDDEKTIASMRLDKDDQDFFSDWAYVSHKGAQEEIVEYLVVHDGEVSQVCPTRPSLMWPSSHI